MSIFLSGATCPSCGKSRALEMEAEEAAHDEQWIDIVVTCLECHAVFNSFINVNEMEQLP